MTTPRSERAVVWTLTAFTFVNLLDFMMVLPLGPDYARDLAFPVSRLGWVGGCYTGAAALASLLGSFFFDRFDRKRALLVCIGGLSLASASVCLVNGLGSLLAARVLAGLFAGPASSLSIAIMADVVPAERRGRAMAIMMSSMALVTVLGVPAALFLGERFGWQTPFLAVAVLGLFVWVLSAWALPAMRGHLIAATAHDAVGNLRILLRTPSVAGSLLLPGLHIGAMFVLVPYISPYVQHNLAYPRSELATLYLAGGGVSLIGMQMSGPLVDRIGVWRVYLASSILLVIVLVAGFVTSPPMLPVLAFFPAFMLAMSTRNVPFQALVSRVPPMAQRAQYMGLSTAAMHLSASLGSFTGPLLLSSHDDGSLVGVPGAAAIGIVGALCVPVLLARLERRVRLNEARWAQDERAPGVGGVAGRGPA